MAVQMVVPRAAADRTANGMKVEHGRTFRKLAGRATKTNNAHLHLRGLPSPLGIILYNMYYSLGIRGRTVPQNLYPSYVCAISPDVAKSPPPTHRPQHRMSPPRRTPAASPPLSMESSSMAPNHGAEAPHESDAGARWRGLVLATLLPLVLGAQTRPMENESGGRGLAIMWPPFV